MPKSKYTNELINSSSPYLLQHAHNPVNWFPWSDEALEEAKKEDKPILVSIGYSSCHWCHVMERESFENEEIANIMNEHFINIKIDREERSDLDQIYMDAVQVMGLRGGWPLNVFLTPSQMPFYGGTYFPPKQWINLLKSIHSTFHSKRSEIEESAHKLTDHLGTSEVLKFGLTSSDEPFTDELLTNFHKKLIQKVDPVYGGMDPAPKFPMPSHWRSLLRQYQINEDTEIKDILLLTLDQMEKGGIYDQIGGGFARYSTDQKWFAPHFEKMLYDNGQLLCLYAEAYMIFELKEYKEVVTKTIDWLKRDMLHPDGGFYSALDADTEGMEGYYYVWKDEELTKILGEDYSPAKQIYSFHHQGNWEGEFNILHRRFNDEELMEMIDLNAEEYRQAKSRIDSKLLEARYKKKFPGLDDKVISGWNGLAISGLCQAYRAFGDPEMKQLAHSAGNFIVQNLIKEGVLFRSFKNQAGEVEAFLEDYAFVIHGFIDLYEIEFDESWIQKASMLTERVIDHFYDPEEGMFFYTSIESEELIARKKELFDNVIPSSNSQMAINLLKLSGFFGRDNYKEIARGMVSKMSKLMSQEPYYLTNWSVAYHLLYKGIKEVVITGPENQLYRDKITRKFIPDTILMGAETESNLELLQEKLGNSKKTMVYVCVNKTCQLPVDNVTDAGNQIKNA